jgi:hypothetical protein
MKIYNHSFINKGARRLMSILAVYLFSCSLTAQEIEERKVRDHFGNIIVVADFIPTISDATKILMNPEIEDSPIPEIRIIYNVESRRYETSFNVEPIRPATLRGDTISKLYNHFVKGGFGNYTSPLFQYAFNSGRSTNLSYGLLLNHLSSRGKIENYGFPGTSDNSAQAYIRKSSGKYLWSMDLDYNRNVNHLYGFRTDDTTFAFPTDKSNYKQSFNDFRAKGGMSLLTGMKSIWRYDMNVDYGIFSLLDGAMEQNAGLTIKTERYLNKPVFLSEPVLHIKASGDFFHNVYDTLGTQSTGLVKVCPVIAANIGPFNFKIGVNSVITSDAELTDIHFFPLIDLNLHLVSDILILNAMLRGDINRSTYRGFAAENPFIYSNIPTAFTTENVHFSGGLRAGFSKNMNINISFNTSEYSNYALFMPDTLALYGNSFLVKYDNVRLLNVKAEMLYQASQKLRIGFKGNFYEYETDGELEAWYKPQFDARLSFMYNLYNSIIVTADFNVIGERFAPVYQRNATDNMWELDRSTLKPFYDLSLGMEYRLNKLFSGFLMLNNLTAKRHEYWYNYYGHGFNFMAGLTYTF